MKLASIEAVTSDSLFEKRKRRPEEKPLGGGSLTHLLSLVMYPSWRTKPLQARGHSLPLSLRNSKRRKILKLSKQIPFINKEAELSNRIVLSRPPVNLEGGKNEICCTFEGVCKIEHGYNCKSDVCKSDESTPSIQSKRGTKRRERFTSLIRYKQVRKAELKCTQKKSHPEIHRDTVRKYTQSHLKVNRDAVRKYTQSHPEVHRDAVRKYTQSHPEINRDAVRKYTQYHLEINRMAVRKYTQKHPEINRKAVKNYVSKNSHVAQTKNNEYKEKISEIR
ncbi:hypothetical protein TNCV_1643151 [Trichonephila clavipes]|nr:hypothetical protein TNCV_1643151 [Trichonephila clavipes]